LIKFSAKLIVYSSAVFLKLFSPLFTDMNFYFVDLKLSEKFHLSFVFLQELKFILFTVCQICICIREKLIILFWSQGHSVLLVYQHEFLLYCIADLLTINLNLSWFLSWRRKWRFMQNQIRQNWILLFDIFTLQCYHLNKLISRQHLALESSLNRVDRLSIIAIAFGKFLTDQRGHNSIV
jgi:hypothetical protein